MDVSLSKSIGPCIWGDGLVSRSLQLTDFFNDVSDLKSSLYYFK